MARFSRLGHGECPILWIRKGVAPYARGREKRRRYHRPVRKRGEYIEKKRPRKKKRPRAKRSQKGGPGGDGSRRWRGNFPGRPRRPLLDGSPSPPPNQTRRPRPEEFDARAYFPPSYSPLTCSLVVKNWHLEDPSFC